MMCLDAGRRRRTTAGLRGRGRARTRGEAAAEKNKRELETVEAEHRETEGERLLISGGDRECLAAHKTPSMT